MLSKRISKDEFYKRFKRPSRDDLLNDPDTYESMSREVAAEINDRFAYHMLEGKQSYEDAKILSRMDAGVHVDPTAGIAPQNQLDVNILRDHMNKDGKYAGPYNKESSNQKADKMAMPGTQARRKEASKGDNFLNSMLEKIKGGGQKVVELASKGDEAYANMLGSNIKGDSKRATYRRLLEATPLSEIKVTGADSAVDSIQANLAATGIRAANIGVRYMLPPGAATAGAVGIMELTNALSPADYQEEGQIRIS